ncbi:hypothetical protein MYAM1_003140 [Malassezia yamatoensis]|uniref:Etoposide-induced protein 2.4 n=1 Tax=Malassezia yamatoensis TaxID=253288 RepID=A0AAJ6CIL5_9BASI|nr:hypothetical protein MYAM1_003140 [Malassezia yamatoensis]
MKRHERAFLQSVDLDTDANSALQVDEDYDLGWSNASFHSWSAKAPYVYTPRMSLARSAKLHLHWARSGWQDANRWKGSFELAQKSRALQIGLLKGLLLSGAVCIAVHLFSLSLVPELEWLGQLQDSPSGWIGTVSNAFWLYPLIACSYLVASTWTMSIAEAAYLARNIQVAKPVHSASQSYWIENASRIILIANYSLLCFALQYIPWIGPFLAFLMMSIIDAYFCFEQVWTVRGWSFEKRLRFCESHWSYLLGFGLPSTAVSFFHPSGLLNLMLFMLVFPFCTVLAFLADPLPRNGSGISEAGVLPGTPQRERSKDLSAFLPGRIPLFWPTVRIRRWLTARLVSKGAFSDPQLNKPNPTYGIASANTSSTPRRSAAQFVGGAWTESPTPPSTREFSRYSLSDRSNADSMQSSSISIPLAVDQPNFGARKFTKRT